MRRLIPALLGLFLLAAPALAQDPDLDRVETLIRSGDYAAARSAIDRWWQAVDDGRDVAPEARARAHLLRARLAPDPLTAERDYLAVALGHPTSPHAAPALLSLGQGLLAAGDISRAASYLQRLVDDYPGTPLRTVGLLWLVRARRLDGATASACTLARNGLAAAEGDLATLLRREASAACPRTAPDDDAPAADGRSDAKSPDDPAPAATGRFAVQSGAFRQARGAHDLADRLRRAGYEPRLVFVAGSSLLRVRVGRFPSAAAADSLADRLRAAGFPAVVVRNADRERSPE
ncbi:MAG TPA: SPOR domain-containing protein [Longimicrobiales bacterium]